MQLFYNENIALSDNEIHFPKDESKHIVKVLRKNTGDRLHITNGKGYIFEAEITQASPSNCKAKINTTTSQNALPYTLHMAVAPTKLNDRYEWFLEKATEIGISTITPIICDHSERKVIKAERYERIVQSAMKQSLNAYKPTLQEAINFTDFLDQVKDDPSTKCIAHCEETHKQSLKAILHNKPKNIVILIGPEGDFSQEEISKAKEAGFIPVTLGDTRLRTETAAIAAVHSVSYSHQD